MFMVPVPDVEAHPYSANAFESPQTLARQDYQQDLSQVNIEQPETQSNDLPNILVFPIPEEDKEECPKMEFEDNRKFNFLMMNEM